MSASTSTKHCLLVLCLLVLATASQAKVHVYMTNDFGNKIDLTVHCKSKNDDLGAHLLHDKEVYQIAFNPNIWGTTRYFCSFEWTNEKKSFQRKSFDIYVYDRDSDRCADCRWLVRPTGPCYLNDQTGKIDTCYGWNM